MNSHAWTAAGWTMLQVGWIGAGIGLIAALGRRLMYDARAGGTLRTGPGRVHGPGRRAGTGVLALRVR